MKEVNYVKFCKDVDDLSDYTVPNLGVDQKATSYTSESIIWVFFIFLIILLVNFKKLSNLHKL